MKNWWKNQYFSLQYITGCVSGNIWSKQIWEVIFRSGGWAAVNANVNDLGARWPLFCIPLPNSRLISVNVDSLKFSILGSVQWASWKPPLNICLVCFFCQNRWWTRGWLPPTSTWARYYLGHKKFIFRDRLAMADSGPSCPAMADLWLGRCLATCTRKPGAGGQSGVCQLNRPTDALLDHMTRLSTEDFMHLSLWKSLELNSRPVSTQYCGTILAKAVWQGLAGFRRTH